MDFSTDYPFGLVGSSGLEPPTSRLSGVRSNHLSYEPTSGGDEEVRTPDPLRARQVLSQLSYTPIHGMASVLCFEVSAELALNRALKIKQYSQTLQIPVPAIGHRSVRVCLTP